jgi:hypothetical protein
MWWKSNCFRSAAVEISPAVELSPAVEISPAVELSPGPDGLAALKATLENRLLISVRADLAAVRVKLSGKYGNAEAFATMSADMINLADTVDVLYDNHGARDNRSCRNNPSCLRYLSKLLYYCGEDVGSRVAVGAIAAAKGVLDRD